MDTVEAGSEHSETMGMEDERSRSNRHGWGGKYCRCHTNGRLGGRVVVNGRWVVVDNVVPGLLRPINVAEGGARAAGGANSVSVRE